MKIYLEKSRKNYSIFKNLTNHQKIALYLLIGLSLMIPAGLILVLNPKEVVYTPAKQTNTYSTSPAKLP